MTPSRTLLAAVAAGAALATAAGSALAPAQAHRDHSPAPDDLTTVAPLSGPRGVDSVGRGLTLVTEDDGTFSLVIERRHGPAEVRELGGLPAAAGFAQAISAARGKVYFLTGGGGPAEELPAGAATLYVWHHGDLEEVADIGTHQIGDPDPYDLEEVPTDTNPYGMQALKDGTVLVADAGGNDLLRVWPNGKVKTVAVFKPRVVEVPDDLPAPPEAPMRALGGSDPEPEPPAPPAPTMPAESVPTSVTVGADGYWYVGELRGFPATPGTSLVWRIKPGSRGAVCDPAPYDARGDRHERRGGKHRSGCTPYADGLTSIVDLAADRHGAIYALSLSKASWLQAESGTPGAEIGGLFRITPHRGHTHTRELVPGRLTLPGGVDVAKDGTIYLTGPVFGPGALMKLE
ncbi:ScyD/ScyE family protein [Nocardioides deserti]|uniref:ScyD/ScyE family protein n=1 Tax=Nocardioides deserti TaxID=1588644 RepID=A0ABR6UDP5_9ACTN|nr:ScyD/ScyE family protein [Nocardioides deserti]MBC2962064.1 ScyD/ScyE family protein [Nocardioides deserti]GGO78917.1 hypothetical protein GCM10012276_37480 [Nocardioides deserti]